jgi:hypothetical protein
MSAQHAYTQDNTEPELGRLRRGMRVLFTRGFNYAPYTYVMVGETGTVVWHDPNTGGADIELDQPHRGLAQWDNCISLIAPACGGDCQDLEEALEVILGGSP